MITRHPRRNRGWMLLLLLLICCHLGTVKGGLQDEEDFLDGKAKANELDLFKNKEEFGKRTENLFHLIDLPKMQDLVQHVMHAGWLAELAKDLDESESDAIFHHKDVALIAAAMPIFNELPVDRLETIPREGYELLWQSSTKEASIPFEAKKLAKLKEEKQAILLPQVPIGMRSFFSVNVLLKYVDEERCDLLPTSILETRNIEMAKRFNSRCLGQLKGSAVTVESPILKLMAADAFEQISPNLMNQKTYANMSVAQLAAHLVRNVPTVEKIKVIPGNTLAKAVESMLSEPANCFLVSPALLDVLPADLMKYFGTRFWANADPAKLWSISSTHLINLSSTSLAAVAPAILRTIIITETSRSHRSHQRVGEIIAKLGTVGRDDGGHPCQSPRNFLSFAAPSSTVNLSTDCIESMEPATFGVFTTASHLNSLSDRAVGVIRGSQVRNIPVTALTDAALPFLNKLMSAAKRHYSDTDVDEVACGGFTPGQVANLKKSTTWASFNYECFSVLGGATLAAIPEDIFGRIPAGVFSKITMPPDEDVSGIEIMALLLGKISGEQLAVFGEEVVEDDMLHPCYDVAISWNHIGGVDRNKSVVNRMSPRCFALLDSMSYDEMAEGEISRMHDQVFAYINSPARFAKIPARALLGVRPTQVDRLKPGVLGEISIDQLMALAKNNVTRDLRTELVADIPSEVFVESLKKQIGLREDVLAGFSAVNFYHGSWIGEVGDQLNHKQWQQLGVKGAIAGQPHPCGYLRYEQVELTSGSNKSGTFWKGMSADCLAALSFLDRLTVDELDLIPDSSFTQLSVAQKDQLSDRLGTRLRRLEYAQNCADYPPDDFAAIDEYQYELLPSKCYGRLKPAVWKAFPAEKIHFIPKKAFNMMNTEMIGNLTPHALQALNAQQWSAISSTYKGIGCNGFTLDQVSVLRLDLVSSDCFHFIDPILFTALTQEQFDRIPKTTWEESISREQVAAIPAASFASFPVALADRVGVKWKRSLSLHPLLGFTEKQLAAMPVGAREATYRLQKLLPEEARKSRFRWSLYFILGVLLIIAIVGAIFVYRYLIIPRWRRSSLESDDHP